MFKKQPLLRFDPKKILKFILINIVIFYGIKWYYDTRQTRLVTTLIPSVVKVSPIGDQYITLELLGLEIRVRVGFGPMGHGSGVFISKDGMIVTCAHVVDGTPLAEISLLDGKKVKAYVLGRDEEHDVALLKLCVPAHGIVYVSIGKAVEKGLSVLTIGYPGPFERYVTSGIISGYMNDDIFSDLVIAPGNSGGGVFDMDGRLVGLARAMTGPLPIPIYQGFSVLTSLEAIQKIVEKYSGF